MSLIKKFNSLYPNGSIVSQRIMTEEPGVEIFKATVTPDLAMPERYFSAYAKTMWNLQSAQDKAIKLALKLLSIG